MQTWLLLAVLVGGPLAMMLPVFLLMLLSRDATSQARESVQQAS
jgi:hypothetical protein